MKIKVIYCLLNAFALFLSCANNVNSIKEDKKKESTISVNDTLNRVPPKLLIQKDYFKSSFNLYKDTIGLKDDLQLFDQFISVINYNNDQVSYNIDSLVFDVNLLFFDTTDAKYTLNQCLSKTYNSIYKVNSYGDVSVYEYTNQRKAGCGEYNNYICINKERNEVLLVRANTFSVQHNKNLVFRIDVRGTKGNTYKISYDSSSQHFERSAAKR